MVTFQQARVIGPDDRPIMPHFQRVISRAQFVYSSYTADEMQVSAQAPAGLSGR
jgi:hypothetical protein